MWFSLITRSMPICCFPLQFEFGQFNQIWRRMHICFKLFRCITSLSEWIHQIMRNQWIGHKTHSLRMIKWFSLTISNCNFRFHFDSHWIVSLAQINLRHWEKKPMALVHKITWKDDFLVHIVFARFISVWNLRITHAESDFCTHFRRSTFIKWKTWPTIHMKC